jgi:hypothetical protein
MVKNSSHFQLNYEVVPRDSRHLDIFENQVLKTGSSSDNTKIFANASITADGPFSCPGCRSELILRKGKIKTHHFAYNPH